MTVSDQIIEVLNVLCEKFGLAIDWTNANVVPYISTLCEKLITWEIWSSVAWMGIMVVVCIIWFIVMKIYREPLNESWSEGDFIGVMSRVFSVVIPVATIIVIGVQVFDIIKCVTFPELTIIEYIQRLMNPST